MCDCGVCISILCIFDVECFENCVMFCISSGIRLFCVLCLYTCKFSQMFIMVPLCGMCFISVMSVSYTHLLSNGHVMDNEIQEKLEVNYISTYQTTQSPS